MIAGAACALVWVGAWTPSAPARQPDEPADLPGCQAAWSGQVESMQGYRRTPVVSFWLRNGIRVHHLKMAGPKVRGEPMPLTRRDETPRPASERAAEPSQPASAGAGAEPEPEPAPMGGMVSVTINVVGGELRETTANRGVSIGACAPWDDLSVLGVLPARAQVALEGRSVRLEAVPGQDTLQLRISARRADLEEAMRVATALLLRPQVTPDGLRDVMLAARRRREQRMSMERDLVAGAIAEAMFPADDPRLRLPTDAELEAVTVEQAQAWLDDHLRVGGAPIEVSVVGDVTLEDAMRLTAGYLGQIPPRERVSPQRTRSLRALPAPTYPMSRTIRRAIEPDQAIVVVGFPGADAVDTRDLRTMRVAARLLDERTTQALAEAGFEAPDVAAAALPASVYPGYGVVVANLRCERSRADEAADVMLAALERLVTDGARPEELPPILEELARGVEQFERLPWYWAGILARADTIGVSIDEVAAGATFYRALNVETVNGAMKRNYGDGRTIRVIIEGDTR